MSARDYQEILSKYADLIIKVGLNLQPGQKLFIWAEQLEVAPLVRQVVEKAYQEGSQLVSVLWNDDQLKVSRFKHAPRDSFDEYPEWKADARYQRTREGDAILYISGKDPDLFQGQDPELVSQAARVYFEHLKPARELSMKNATQWCVVCPPTADWAVRVFPDLLREEAESQLWDAVIQTCRLEEDDPTAFWMDYFDKIKKTGEYLTGKAYSSMRFQAPGTDLKIGLPEGHIWIGGWDKSLTGIRFGANLPSEEVFTLPHREMTEGTVTATKPLSYLGSLIDGFSFTFKAGRVVDFSAKVGEDALRSLLESDPNAPYLGEVALVPHNTPISQLGISFLNTLYDENASNHLAFGNAYQVSLEGGAELSPEEFNAVGGNTSIIHEDFMFGSGEMDVDGILADGSSEPVMRGGEWAFELE
jgi:aminopeptidase